MALSATYNFKGLQINNVYFKIIAYSALQSSMEGETPKEYVVDVMVAVYLDGTKANKIEDLHFHIDGFLLEDLTIEKMYGRLKQERIFENAVDV